MNKPTTIPEARMILERALDEGRIEGRSHVNPSLPRLMAWQIFTDALDAIASTPASGMESTPQRWHDISPGTDMIFANIWKEFGHGH